MDTVEVPDNRVDDSSVSDEGQVQPDWLTLASSALGRGTEPGEDVHSPPSPKKLSPKYKTTPSPVKRSVIGKSSSEKGYLKSELTIAKQRVKELERKLKTQVPDNRNSENVLAKTILTAQRQELNTRNPHLPASRLPVLIRKLKQDSSLPRF